MRTYTFYATRLVTVLLLVMVFNHCSDECKVKNRYVYYAPVYTSLAEIRSSVDVIAPREMESPGRIYFKDNYLFINEAGKGVHVIDNRNPAQPKPVSFITIPGNYDIAILGSTLFADSYVDLVALDITDVANATEIGRAKDMFNSYGTNFSVDPTQGVITDWEKVEEMTQYESACDVRIQPWGGYWEDRGAFMMESAATGFNKTTALAPGGATTGIGGSLARFAIKDQNLFILDGSLLEVVDISKPTNLQVKNSQTVAWDIETIFPHNNSLFIGSKSGMYIFNIETPHAPQLLSQYIHVRSCDPVVVEGDYAYVTLRDGNTCAGFVNQLEVINVKDLTAPWLMATYNMTNPHGLGIDNNVLFICDGKDGLKVFDATDVMKIGTRQLARYASIRALDIIPFNHIAMMIAEDGLYQYDYSDLQNIHEISRLPIITPAQ
jgi:hypothetical protein